jgi:hypothetical protein
MQALRVAQAESREIDRRERDLRLRHEREDAELRHQLERSDWFPATPEPAPPRDDNDAR